MATQFDMNAAEALGLLKLDVLGLRTLSILDACLGYIEAETGARLDLDGLPLDDEAALDVFRRGQTDAVFQFESSGMKEWLVRLQPDGIEDLVAMNALYRPGPMDNIPTYIRRKEGRERVRYPHPVLEEVLRPTYGLIVYQEQVMRVAQLLSGYSLGEADLLRRAVGKKKAAEMEAQRERFVGGAVARGVSEAVANEVFEEIAHKAAVPRGNCLPVDRGTLHAHGAPSPLRERALQSLQGNSGRSLAPGPSPASLAPFPAPSR